MAKKKALEGAFEYLEYVDSLSKEDAAWVRQFYNEYEAGGSYGQENPILTTNEQLKDARRKYNNLYRDAYNVSRNIGKLKYTEDQREVMELASDEQEWETAYVQGGLELAIHVIMDQATRDIEAGQELKVCLSRFYVKMERARKNKQREPREKQSAKRTKK